MRIIRGKYGRRRFDVPTNISARPTTDFARENLFNVLENIVDFEDGRLRALDLFGGTGAISFELLSRGCESVTTVEKAATQYNFIRKVDKLLGADNHRVIKSDVFRFLATAATPYDIVFADPPYDLPEFEEVPGAILGSKAVTEGTLVIIEHSAKRDFTGLSGFMRHLAYGSVNFTILRVPEMQKNCGQKM